MVLKFIQIMFVIVVYYDYKIWQIGVKTTFLSENLLEDIYMAQPSGFILDRQANKVCRLQRSIYGLKHTFKSWIICLYQAIK